MVREGNHIAEEMLCRHPAGQRHERRLRLVPAGRVRCYETEREPSGEPAHTLGGGRQPAHDKNDLRSGWPTGSGPVATPQTNHPGPSDPEKITNYSPAADHRVFLSHVRPLQYPTELGGNPDAYPHDCGDVPLTTVGLPICDNGKCSWHGVFEDSKGGDL